MSQDTTLEALVRRLLTEIQIAAGSAVIGKVSIDQTTPGTTNTVSPQMASGGNTSVQTAATGSNYTAFASQACKQLTIVNNTGTKLEFQQGGSGIAVPIFDQSSFSIFGITNASQIGVRRVDTSNTQVTAQARWEA